MQYSVSVVGTLPGGTTSPVSNAITFTTPEAGSPIVVDAVPTSPTSATVLLNPPAGSTAPVDSYIVTLCPAGSTSGCVTQTCLSASCPVTGLVPGTSYDVTAVAVIGGQTTPVSNTAALAMPPAGAPALVSADDTSSTTASVTARPPPGTTPISYTFTAVPLDGGAPVVVTSTRLTAALAGLDPATQYEVTVTARLPDGTVTAASEPLAFVTPPEK